MKYLIILADGAADLPIPGFDNKTPLEVSEIPCIHRMAKEGICGMLTTVPQGFHPGSEIANLGVLGYDVKKVFEGRGSLEAASMGINIEDGEVAMRCNLITLQDGKIKNHSAGHISSEEAAQLIAYLQTTLGSSKVRFYPGVSYRHLLKIKKGNKLVHTTPPHDILGRVAAEFMPISLDENAKKTNDILSRLILASQQFLPLHPINIKRVQEGKDPANSIWPWSLGYRPQMRPMTERFPIQSGAVISAVDLIFGIGVYAGLKKIEVPGATGLYDTNYEGKAEATIQALRDNDFVFLHVEASDEAGHEGNPILKTKTLENLDKRCIKPIMDEITTWSEPVKIAFLPDHPTPCVLRTHTSDPVPVLIWEPTSIIPDRVSFFSEEDCKVGILGHMVGDEFIRIFFEEEVKTNPYKSDFALRNKDISKITNKR